MTTFFSKFILGYSNLAAPMSELTKKKMDWFWSTECDKAFKELKLKLITAPVLAIPDPAAPFELITDSCGFGIGAVPMQNSRPVASYSRKMTDPERNYVNHEQELLAAIVALKVFRCYLLGNHFTLITDNKPNTYLGSQPTLSRRQARWSEYLQRFHFSWVHKPGNFNVADPLSGNPSFKTLSVVLAVATRRQTQALRPAKLSLILSHLLLTLLLMLRQLLNAEGTLTTLLNPPILSKMTLRLRLMLMLMLMLILQTLLT